MRGIYSSYRHLVIGAGKMGKKHGEMLTAFGDSVIYVDLEFRSDGDGVAGFDSILVCTPPNTHADIIRGIAPAGIPIFVEKPVISLGSSLDGVVFPRTTMVGCNWRYCECCDPTGEIVCVYPTTKEAAAQDLIHFYDWSVQRKGPPDLARFIQGEGGNRLVLMHGKSVFSASILYDGALAPQSWWAGVVGKAQLHPYGPCPMFHSQMIHWRECVAEGWQTDNPIELALKRTNELMRVVERPVTSVEIEREAPMPTRLKERHLL